MKQLKFFIFFIILFQISTNIFAESLDYQHCAKLTLETLDKWYNEETGLWETTSWWNAANIVNALLNYTIATGDTSYIYRVKNTFKIANPSDFLNHYYDDEGWWALSWIKAYEYLGDKKYLNKAVSIFDDMIEAWDENCNGGVYWNKDRKYKNAVTNELFISVAIRLHKLGIDKNKDKSCYDWAMDGINWFINSGMINSTNLINDGLRDCKNNNGNTWTYNQGVILGALVELFCVTNDSTYIILAENIADATIIHLINSEGILRDLNEPDCNADQTQFKGIFIRNLAALYQVVKNPVYKTFIGKNAKSVCLNGRNKSTNEIGSMWYGPFDKADASRQSSALEAINAILLIQN